MFTGILALMGNLRGDFVPGAVPMVTTEFVAMEPLLLILGTWGWLKEETNGQGQKEGKLKVLTVACFCLSVLLASTDRATIFILRDGQCSMGIFLFVNFMVNTLTVTVRTSPQYRLYSSLD